MTIYLCYNCAKKLDVEKDDFEYCTNCDKHYCEACVKSCAKEWYEDNSVIPWIMSCVWCDEDYRF